MEDSREVSAKTEKPIDASFYTLGNNITGIFTALSGCREAFSKIADRFGKLSINKDDKQKLRDELKSIWEKQGEVVKLFRSVQDVNINLINCINWSLPIEIDNVSENTLSDPHLTDSGFAERLVVVTKGKTNVQRLGMYAGILKSLSDGISDLQRKHDKLSSRTKKDGQTKEERAVAIRLCPKIKESISILRRRMLDIAERYFKTRKRVLGEILLTSESVFKTFPKGNEDIITAFKRYDANSALTSLISLDQQCFVTKNHKPINKKGHPK